jgi:N-acetylglucosaminyldiphosphoundecaprenol N-acetyl-beta-D-mannosaminyltransferase
MTKHPKINSKHKTKYKKYAKNELKNLPDLEVYLLGRRINLVTIPRIIEAVTRTCLHNDKLFIASYNVNSFNFSLQIPWFYKVQQSADLARCDGTGILSALSYMGINLPFEYRASGTKLIPLLIERCHEHNFSVFLLGSKEEVLDAALSNLRYKYPNLLIEGHHGYFDINNPQQNQDIIQKINALQPNILIVGMGMPRQEDWIRRYRNQLTVNVILPCGAVIDRLAGLVSNCPEFLSRLGLEWLYRLSCEPKRLAVRYLIGNPAFGLQIALAKASNYTVELNEMSHS